MDSIERKQIMTENETTLTEMKVYSHTCAYKPCSGTVSSTKAIKFGGDFYHPECFSGIILRSVRLAIPWNPGQSFSSDHDTGG